MKLTALLYVGIIVLFVVLSCSKMGGSLPAPPPDPCSAVNISLSGTVINPSVAGASNGSITLIASGSNGFTYSLNAGSFQSSNKFYNLPAGNYMVTAKNPDGCSGTISFNLADPIVSCNGVNIVVTAATTTNVLCETSTAGMTVTATGGVGPYTYCINGGAWQSSNQFSNLVTNSYSIIVKDANGCIGNGSVTINNAAAGPLFSQVRTLIHNNCSYCHSGAISSGGVNYSDDCTIVSNKDRIKARAVDGIPSAMPQTGLLSAAERQKIVDWMNAGGKYTD